MSYSKNHDFYVGIIICIVFLGILFLPFFMAYQESATYNRLTGAHTTWWDAIWVELRVQNDTK